LRATSRLIALTRLGVNPQGSVEDVT
jgi:hypothetical protein